MKPTSVSLPPSPVLSSKRYSIQDSHNQKSLDQLPIVQKRQSSSSQNLKEEKEPLILHKYNFDANSFIKKTLSNYSVKNSVVELKEPIYSRHRPCAYCGQPNEIVRHFLYNEEDDVVQKSTLDDLYCQNCRKLFIERSKSDIQRMLIVQNDEQESSSSSNVRKSGRYSKKETKTFSSSAAAGRKTPSAVETAAIRAQSTWSSCSSLKPLCRICQLPGGDSGRSLINPCRCKGTMQFVHSGCLV
uniref:RING-CH-type domain-containing protein n=1 Tax=Romanomermis culicivorax TaxID=13658 RepID=A0A915K5R5_ROMCU